MRLLIALLAGSALSLGQGVTTFEFGLIGDMPYNEEQDRKFPNLIGAMNRERLEFVVHDGDFQSGANPCTNQEFQKRLDLLNTSEHPLIFVPGDNDWTDCHREAAGMFDPIERLSLLRRLFYPTNQSLGRRTMPLDRQSDYPGHSLYRENVMWRMGGVLFAGLHVVGSNNNWARTEEQNQEYGPRNQATNWWMKLAFARAKEQNLAGVMLIIQANPNFEQARTAPSRGGFNDFLTVLEEEVLAFRRPVVLVHGDTHNFRIDKPLRGTRSGRRIENFTRLETFATDDVHWIRGRVVPGNPNVFVLEQGIVPENLVIH